MKSWTFILFYLFLYKKFTVKLKVKNKTSKKFKKDDDDEMHFDKSV